MLFTFTTFLSVLLLKHAEGQKKCLDLARELAPSEEWLRLLQPKSRSLPDLSEQLCASDWPGRGWQRATELPSDQEYTISAPPVWRGAPPDIVRYKIYQGKLYANHEHYSKRVASRNQREAVVEMLLAALWLYKDFPDVDLYINLSDILQPLSYRVPFLQFTAITGVRRSNLAGHLAQWNAGNGDPVAGQHEDDEDNYDVDPMHMLMWRRGHEEEVPKEWSRGFVIPNPADWRELSMAPEQLRHYSSCVQKRYASGSPAELKSDASSSSSSSSNDTFAQWRMRRRRRLRKRPGSTGALPDVLSQPSSGQDGLLNAAGIAPSQASTLAAQTTMRKLLRLGSDQPEPLSTPASYEKQRTSDEGRSQELQLGSHQGFRHADEGAAQQLLGVLEGEGESQVAGGGIRQLLGGDDGGTGALSQESHLGKGIGDFQTAGIVGAGNGSQLLIPSTARAARVQKDWKDRSLWDPWAATRIAKAVWRGSATGYLRGWSPLTTSQASHYQNSVAKSLLNKRLFLASMSRPYPWLDVGIVRSHWDNALWEYSSPKQGADSAAGRDAAVQAVVQMARKERIDMEKWSRYMLAISIDGHGPPWRLARQLLGMTPIVRVGSPLKEWFAPHLKAGVHFEPIAHDLHDLPVRAKQLIREATQNSTRLQQMALAARELIASKASLLGQLDALVWAILKVKQVCTWEVKPPIALNNSAGVWVHTQSHTSTPTLTANEGQVKAPLRHTLSYDVLEEQNGLQKKMGSKQTRRQTLFTEGGGARQQVVPSLVGGSQTLSGSAISTNSSNAIDSSSSSSSNNKGSGGITTSSNSSSNNNSEGVAGFNEPGWHILQLKRGRRWQTHGLKSVQDAIITALPHHFCH